MNRLLAPTSVNSNSSLSSLNITMNALAGGFARQATDWRSLASMMAGGVAYRGMRAGTMALGSGRMMAGLSVATGLTAEVSAFELAHRGLTSVSLAAHGHAPLQAENSNLWRWSGRGGLGQGFLQSFVTFGALKGAGRLAQGENAVLRHLFQDSGMVLGHQATGAFGITPRPTGSLAEQFLHAEATNLQLGAGMALVHGAFPGLRHIEFNQEISIRRTGSFDLGRLHIPHSGMGWGLLEFAVARGAPSDLRSERTPSQREGVFTLGNGDRPPIWTMSSMEGSGSNPREALPSSSIENSIPEERATPSHSSAPEPREGRITRFRRMIAKRPRPASVGERPPWFNRALVYHSPRTGISMILGEGVFFSLNEIQFHQFEMRHEEEGILSTRGLVRLEASGVEPIWLLSRMERPLLFDFNGRVLVSDFENRGAVGFLHENHLFRSTPRQSTSPDNASDVRSLAQPDLRRIAFYSLVRMMWRGGGELGPSAKGRGVRAWDLSARSEMHLFGIIFTESDMKRIRAYRSLLQMALNDRPTEELSERLVQIYREHQEDLFEGGFLSSERARALLREEMNQESIWEETVQAFAREEPPEEGH